MVGREGSVVRVVVGGALVVVVGVPWSEINTLSVSFSVSGLTSVQQFEVGEGDAL